MKNSNLLTIVLLLSSCFFTADNSYAAKMKDHHLEKSIGPNKFKETIEPNRSAIKWLNIVEVSKIKYKAELFMQEQEIKKELEEINDFYHFPDLDTLNSCLYNVYNNQIKINNIMSNKEAQYELKISEADLKDVKDLKRENILLFMSLFILRAFFLK